MLKQLWKSVAELKTPERRLLFGLMLTIIVVLWLAVRDSKADLDRQIDELQSAVHQMERSKETQRIIMQDKIDKCNEDKLRELKELYEKSEQMKQKISSIK